MSDKPHDDKQQDLRELIGRMHEAVMDTEATGRPDGSLYDTWIELRNNIETSPSSVATNEGGEVPWRMNLERIRMELQDGWAELLDMAKAKIERELAVANSAYAAVEQVNLQMQEASRSAIVAPTDLLEVLATARRHIDNNGAFREKWAMLKMIDDKLREYVPGGK